MPIELEYRNDMTGARERQQGSDGRANTSSRTDERIYYNARDKGQAYSLVYDDAAASAGDFVCTLFNTTPKADAKTLVIHSIGANAVAAATIKLHRLNDGQTAGGGAVSASPYNLGGASNSATVTASTVVNSDSSPISGVTSLAVIDHVSLPANGHEEFRIADTVRLGEDQGIGIELDAGGSRVCGVIFFYFE